MNTLQSHRTACVYIRTAQKRATGHNSVENQLGRCSAAARTMGVAVNGSYVDDGVSGLTQDRPGLSEMMLALRRHPTDCVIVASQDRLARSRMVSLRLERALTATGASLVAADEAAQSPQRPMFEVRMRSYSAMLAAERQDERRRLGMEKRHADSQ
jgi:DNA invertase Pin-like site-specific DNA recombinase